MPLGRTIAVQVTSSCASAVLPPTVGQLALDARFVHRLGHSTASVTAGVGLTQVASLSTTLVLLAAAVTATGTALTLTGTTATVAVVLLLVLAAAARSLRGTGPRLGEVVRQPSRLAAGIGGCPLVTGGCVVALDASLRALGVDLPLTHTAVVDLAGSALGSAAPTPGGTGAVEAAMTVLRRRAVV